ALSKHSSTGDEMSTSRASATTPNWPGSRRSNASPFANSGPMLMCFSRNSHRVGAHRTSIRDSLTHTFCCRVKNQSQQGRDGLIDRSRLIRVLSSCTFYPPCGSLFVRIQVRVPQSPAAMDREDSQSTKRVGPKRG